MAGRLLLVLDNCEHLLPTVISLVLELQARCPDHVELTTSRPLGLTGETALRTPSLSLQADADVITQVDLAVVESVELFLDRAWVAAPSFVLDETTAPAVAAVCRRLGAIPLALKSRSCVLSSRGEILEAYPSKAVIDGRPVRRPYHPYNGLVGGRQATSPIR
jgi:predicted ATPase